ncbi:MAG TPA: SDR family NAD(P)-dependent oxidoreductase [Steroidobacteraceae bacterium]|nr:SDR family NAD(P)-dependent oxidoreductase [Steroidobacteraceae bacterium]
MQNDAATAAAAAGQTRRLERRIALVTGGGSGAGAAIARRCAGMGARVVVADIDFALAGEVAASIRGTGGVALAHRCDVASEEQVATLIDRVQREYGGLDLVFNVAGPWLNGDPLGHWSRIVGANLLGTMYVTRQAIEVLKRRGGAIVNVAADSGLGFGPEDRPAYCAAKAGIVRLTAALHYLREQKIRVNCIVPDVIDAVDDFAAAALNLALREDCAGRVVLYRAGGVVEAVVYGDPGYRETQPL